MEDLWMWLQIMCPAIGWRPVQDVPRILPAGSWYKLRHPPCENKWIRKWMDECLSVILEEFVGFVKNIFFCFLFLLMKGSLRIWCEPPVAHPWYRNGKDGWTVVALFEVTGLLSVLHSTVPLSSTWCSHFFLQNVFFVYAWNTVLCFIIHF